MRLPAALVFGSSRYEPAGWIDLVLAAGFIALAAFGIIPKMAGIG